MTDTLTDTLDPQQADQRRRIEEHAAVQEMLTTPGWAVFHRYAEMLAKEHENVILAGGLVDPHAYKTYTGRLFGIRQVLDIPRIVEAAREISVAPADEWVDEFVPPASLPTHPPADEGDA